MAYVPHLKIVFRGSYVGTEEIWSFGLKFSRVFAGIPDRTAQDFQDGPVLAACNTFFTNARFPLSVRLDEWRAYTIGATGKMMGNPKQVLMAAGSEPKGSGSVQYPPQVALAVTTVAANRGPARFNRFYLPTPATTLTPGDMRLSVANVDAWVTATTAFVKAIADSVDVTGITTDDVSGINVSGTGEGTNQKYDRVRIGRVLDTIRRRRSAMEEEYRESGDIDW